VRGVVHGYTEHPAARDTLVVAGELLRAEVALAVYVFLGNFIGRQATEAGPRLLVGLGRRCAAWRLLHRWGRGRCLGARAQSGPCWRRVHCTRCLSGASLIRSGQAHGRLEVRRPLHLHV
jgi:hypothetical protein